MSRSRVSALVALIPAVALASAGTALAQAIPWEGFSGDIEIPVVAPDPCETYYASAPSLLPRGQNVPLLVLFHSYYKHHDEHTNPIPHTWDDFDIIEQANARGWFVIMPDGGQIVEGCATTPQPCDPHPAGAYFSTQAIDNFHVHLEAALEDAINRFPIDQDRIYGYGFSMGGYEALSYAARHLDPLAEEGMLAAVVSSSGYVSPIHQVICGNGFPNCHYTPGIDYACSGMTQQQIFKWERANVMTLHCSAGCGPGSAALGVSHWDSQVQNLKTMPIRLYYDVHEAAPMREANDYMDEWFGGNLVNPVDCTMPGTCDSMLPDCDDGGVGTEYHQWDNVCADEALDFLEDKTLSARLADSKPAGLVLCAEDDRRYLHFRVTRTDPDDFGRIQWSTGTNRINLLSTPPPDPVHGPYDANVDAVVVVGDDPSLNGADPLSVLDTRNTVRVQLTYGLASLGISGYEAGPPTKVTFSPGGPLHLILSNWTFANGTVSFPAQGVGLYTVFP